jgi:hypothetical protein
MEKESVNRLFYIDMIELKRPIMINLTIHVYITQRDIAI